MFRRLAKTDTLQDCAFEIDSRASTRGSVNRRNGPLVRGEVVVISASPSFALLPKVNNREDLVSRKSSRRGPLK